MPHLSPMNWILAMTMFWLMLMILTSISWWHKSHHFMNMKDTQLPTLQNTWKW